MDDGNKVQALQLEVARQGERMNTQPAKYEGALERLGKQIAERDVDIAKRDKDNLRWQIGLWIAAVTIIGALIHLPG